MSLFDDNHDVIMPPTKAQSDVPDAGDDSECEDRPVADEPSLLTPTTMMTDTPPPTTADSTASMASPSPASSKSPTPPPTKAGPSKKKKKAPLPVQLIGDLPIARAEALSTFTEMKLNWYQSQRMGLSRETMESMNCDCTFKPGRDEPYIACGHNSDCINRLTQVECLPGECRCKEFCQNQRFQNREYATIDIVKTEKKGFGLRAEEDIERDTFIYEYIGDVVDDKKFRRRMREYAEEGIKHFYFMMLQKDEFIDATKNGGIGRFANHSCNPNCYVGKWTIGDRVRMGIFAKRNIKQYEELTFDYNVDRYGHDAQVCHCGEPQCVGFIGGKTQTLSDDMLEALGVDEDDVGEYKASKKRRGKKLDDPDFMPMRYIKVNEVPKVIQALRQNSSPKMVYKLLTRIKITEDPSILRQIMRLRGLTLMKNILEDNSDNIELTTLALECLITWPLTQRNKIEDSQIETELDKRLESTDDTVKELSTKLKAQWETLAVGYRIPKRSAEGELEKTDSLWDVVEFGSKASPPPESNYKRLRLTPPSLPSHTLAPVMAPRRPRLDFKVVERERQKTIDLRPERINAIIAAAKEEAEDEEDARQINKELEEQAAEVRKAEKAEKEAEKERRRKEHKERKEKEKAHRHGSSSSKKHHHHESAEQREANKEKRLLKLVGAVVVKSMSKYAQQMEHDTFKKHAKELTQIIAEKEKKSSHYKDNKLEALSDEKVVKIKKFAKEYIAKVLRKLEKAGKLKKREASSKGAGSEAGPSNGGSMPSEESILQGLTAEVDDRTNAGDGADDSASDTDEDGDGGDVSMDVNMMPSMSRPPDSESPMEVDPPTYEQALVSGHRTVPMPVIGKES